MDVYRQPVKRSSICIYLEISKSVFEQYSNPSYKTVIDISEIYELPSSKILSSSIKGFITKH